MKRALVAVAVIAIAVAMAAALRCRGEHRAELSSTSPTVSLRAALARARALAQRPAPRGELAGTIRSEAGAPLTGATVCARLDSPDADREPPCAISDDSGRYRIGGLAAGTYQIAASAPTFVPAWWTGPPPARATWLALADGERRATVDVVLAAGGARVRGVVDDLGGRPLADAWVEADARDLDGEVPIVRARSAADGTFELWTAPGTVSVSAGADGYAEERATVEAPTDRIPLYLMPAGVISGVVVDGVTSEPIADAKVRVVSSITGSDDHPITSAADGTFRISGLTGGWYRVRAEVPGGWGESPENLLVGIGQTVADATIVMHRVGSVSGRIVIDGGAGPPQGCPHGSVVLIRPNRILVADSDSDGHVVFPSVTPGDYQVGFHCDDHPVREDAPPLTVGAEGAAGIVWTVARGERLTGTVRDHRGRPVRGALVEADAEDDQRCRHPKDWRAARPTGPSRSRGCYPVATVFTHPPATAPRSATRTPPSR